MTTQSLDLPTTTDVDLDFQSTLVFSLLGLVISLAVLSCVSSETINLMFSSIG